MSLAFNGTSSKLVYNGTVVTGYPFSIFCWIKPANITSGMMVAGQGDFGALEEFALYADGTFAGDPARAFAKSGAASVAASSPLSMQANVWKPALVVYTSTTSRRAYLLTGDGAVETTSLAPNFGVMDRFVIGCRPISDTLFFSGSLAHCAVWNRALTRAEFELLAKGYEPDKVATTSLVEYWPLTASAATQTGINGTVLTATSTSTGADAPPMSALPIDYPTLNGIWTWYTDPRAVEYNGSLYIGSITTSGSVAVQKINYTTLQHDVFYLSVAMEADDHDNAAILILPDGRIACFYCKHNDTVFRYRVSTTAEDISAFGAEQTFTSISGVSTYSNPFILSADPTKIWDFFRDGPGGAFNSWLGYRTTTDLSTWAAETRVFTNGAVTPYTKYASNGIDRIDFCITDIHPVQGQSSLYHFYMQLDGSNVPHYYKTDGTEIVASLPFGPDDVTLVYDGSTVRGWNWGVSYGSTGNPKILGTRYPANDGSDIRYMHWGWSGSAWTESEIVADGSGLFSPEIYYAGGICFDGNDANVIYLSKPESGVREIQKWISTDDGDTWTKDSDITTGTASGILNARPFSPKNYTRVPYLYWSGTYTTYQSYVTAVVVSLLPGSVIVSGTLAATETGADTFTSLGSVIVSGALAATETGLDTFQGSGVEVSTGDLAATETGADTFTSTGSVIVSGTLAATETGSDTFQGSGAAVASGALAATEVGDDTFASSGTQVSTGALAATETGTDTFSATGNVIVSGTLSVSETGSDIFAGVGGNVSVGSLTTTETGADTFVASGSVLVSGALAATEQNDTFAASGNVIVAGTLAASETGTDTFSSAGGAVIAGTFAATESGNDTFAASGTIVVTGTLAATEQSDTFSATGNVIVAGTLTVTEQPDTFSATGGVVISGVFGATETGNDVFLAYDSGSAPTSAIADTRWSLIVKESYKVGLIKRSDYQVIVK